MADQTTNKLNPTQRQYWDRDPSLIKADLMQKPTFKALSPTDQDEFIGELRGSWGIKGSSAPATPPVSQPSAAAPAAPPTKGNAWAGAYEKGKNAAIGLMGGVGKTVLENARPTVGGMMGKVGQSIFDATKKAKNYELTPEGRKNTLETAGNAALRVGETSKSIMEDPKMGLTTAGVILAPEALAAIGPIAGMFGVSAARLASMGFTGLQLDRAYNSISSAAEHPTSKNVGDAIGDIAMIAPIFMEAKSSQPEEGDRGAGEGLWEWVKGLRGKLKGKTGAPAEKLKAAIDQHVHQAAPEAATPAPPTPKPAVTPEQQAELAKLRAENAKLKGTPAPPVRTVPRQPAETPTPVAPKPEAPVITPVTDKATAPPSQTIQATPPPPTPAVNTPGEGGPQNHNLPAQGGASTPPPAAPPAPVEKAAPVSPTPTPTEEIKQATPEPTPQPPVQQPVAAHDEFFEKWRELHTPQPPVQQPVAAPAQPPVPESKLTPVNPPIRTPKPQSKPKDLALNPKNLPKEEPAPAAQTTAESTAPENIKIEKDTNGHGITTYTARVKNANGEWEPRSSAPDMGRLRANMEKVGIIAKGGQLPEPFEAQLEPEIEEKTDAGLVKGKKYEAQEDDSSNGVEQGTEYIYNGVDSLGREWIIPIKPSGGRGAPQVFTGNTGKVFTPKAKPQSEAGGTNISPEPPTPKRSGPRRLGGNAEYTAPEDRTQSPEVAPEAPKPRSGPKRLGQGGKSPVANSDTSPQFAKTSAGKVKMGADVKALAEELGSSLYAGKAHQVVTKELIQNAFDAIRGTTSGEVNVDINRENNTISVSDNGKGMTKKDLETVFVDLGASGKRNEADASGGFGLAKAAPLMMSDRITVTTVSDMGGKRYMNTMETNKGELLGGGADIQTVEVPKTTPTGTTVTTVMPADYYGMGDAKNYALRSLKSIKPPGKVNVTYNGEALQPGSYDYDELNLEERKSTKKAATFHLPGADVDIHVTHGQKGLQQSMGSINIEINNNGIYQFDKSIYLGDSAAMKGVPSVISADVKAKVKEGHPDYPFTANRESVRGEIDEKVRSWVLDTIVKPAQEKANAFIEKKYNNLPVIGKEFGAVLFDSGARLKPEELKFLKGSADFVNLTEDISQVIDDTLVHLGENPGPLKKIGVEKLGEDIERAGIVLSDAVHGVHIVNGSTGKATIFINPFTAEEGSTPRQAASLTWHTIKHEIMHDKIKGHNQSFTSAFVRVDEALAELAEDAKNRLHYSYADPANPKQFRPDLLKARQIYTDSRARPANERDPFKGEE